MDQTCWFAAEFSEPFTVGDTLSITDKEQAVALYFDTSAQKQVFVKVGISPVSCANAWANLQAEQPGWDFDGTVAAAKARWNKELGRIDIESMDERQRKIFYTALYHTMIAPELFSDVNQEDQYTVLSLWDTYRAASPLMTLINPEMSKSMASTFMNIYERQGKLPVWHLAGNETDCMVGNPGVIVMADLCLKGYVDDVPAALEAMKVSAMRRTRPGTSQEVRFHSV